MSTSIKQAARDMATFIVHPLSMEVGSNELDVTVCRFDEEVSNYASDKNHKDENGNPIVFVSSKNAKTIEVLTKYLTKKDPETGQYIIASGTTVWVTAGPTLQHRQDVVASATDIRHDLKYTALTPEQESELFRKSVPHLGKPGTILINSGGSTTNFVVFLADGTVITLEASTKDPEAMASSMLKIIEAVGTVRNVILAGSMAFVPLWIGVPCHESWMTSMPLEHFMEAVLHQFQLPKDPAEKPKCFPKDIQESIMCMLDAMSGKVDYVYIGARPSKPGVKPPIEELYKIMESNGVASTPGIIGTL